MNSTRPTIIKVHRDILLDPYNTPDTTCHLDISFENALKPILSNSPMIIIGYGGNDQSIMNLLKAPERQAIYWCVRNTENINKNITDLITPKDRIVEIDGFDELMLALYSKVYNFESIKSLTEEDDNKSLIVINALKKVQIYKKQLQNFMEEVTESKSEDFKENSKSIMPDWWDLQLEINKEEDLELKNIMYEEAVNKNPKSYELLGNWGNTLANLAKLKEDEKLFNLSFEKYQQASKLNPKDDSIFYNLGNALLYLARLNEDENLFNLSFEKYEQASKLNPKKDSIFNNWGTALWDLAKLKEDENLFNLSFKKLSKAIELGGKKYNLACFYAVKNKKKEALELLDDSLKEKEIKASFVLDDEDWILLKEDKDFLKIINKYKE